MAPLPKDRFGCRRSTLVAICMFITMEAFVNAPRLFSSSKSQLLKSSSSSLSLSSSSSGAHSRLFANSKITKKKEYRDTCTGVYPACTSWLQSLQDNVVLVLVGNELYQQLPTVGYGGIETSVDNIASALHQMKIPFIGLVPKRKLVQDLGFRILETEIFANGKGGFKGRYIDEVRAILHEEFKAVKEHILSLQFGSSSGSGSSFTSREEEEKKKGKEAVKFLTDSSRKRMWRSVNPNQDVIIDLGKDEEEKRKKLKELIPSYLRVVIWGQSEWSQHFADLSTLTLVSHHDGGGPLPDWNRGLSNVIHRFLSSDQISQWVIPDGRNLGKNAVYSSNVLRAKVVPHGLPRTAYGMCPDKGYFLWVASLDWGWKEKGLDIFLKMAEKRPQYKFIAYGTGKTEMAQRFMSELTILSKTLTNFLFRGELKRDKHFAAFCGATAFVMPTHASIGESFGMTVIESLSKGVPVIASTNGAVPEVLGIGGDIIKLKSSGMLDASRAVLSGTSRFGVTCDGEDYDCYLKATDTFWNRSETSSKEIMIHAWNRFDGLFVVDSLLNYTIEGLSLVASH